MGRPTFFGPSACNVPTGTVLSTWHKLRQQRKHYLITGAVLLFLLVTCFYNKRMIFRCLNSTPFIGRDLCVIACVRVRSVWLLLGLFLVFVYVRGECVSVCI